MGSLNPETILSDNWIVKQSAIILLNMCMHTYTYGHKLFSP